MYIRDILVFAFSNYFRVVLVCKGQEENLENLVNQGKQACSIFLDIYTELLSFFFFAEKILYKLFIVILDSNTLH